jgi:hypothetical protein
MKWCLAPGRKVNQKNSNEKKSLHTSGIFK